MPAVRNVAPIRHSRRLLNDVPVIYDKDGWQLPDRRGAGDLFDAPIPISSTLPPSLISPLSSDFSHPAHGLKDTPDRSPFLSRPFSAASESSSPPHTPPPPRKKKSHARRRDANYVPRPRNASICFRSAFVRGEFAASAGALEPQQNELSKRAAQMWNRMSDAEKYPFCELAKIEQEEHRVMYPDYVYTPISRDGRASAKLPRAPAKTKTTARALRTSGKGTGLAFSDTSSEARLPASSVDCFFPFDKLSLADVEQAMQYLALSPSSIDSDRPSPISDDLQYPPSPLAGKGSPQNQVHGIPKLKFTFKLKPKVTLEKKHVPPSSFRAHLDSVAGQHMYQQRTHNVMSSSLPTPLNSAEFFDGVVHAPPMLTINPCLLYSSPGPSSLFCDKAYPRDNFSSMTSNFDIGDELDIDSELQQLTDDMNMTWQSLDSHVQSETQDSDDMWRFINFDLGA